MGKFLAFSSLDLPFHNIKSYLENSNYSIRKTNFKSVTPSGH